MKSDIKHMHLKARYTNFKLLAMVVRAEISQPDEWIKTEDLKAIAEALDAAHAMQKVYNKSKGKG